MYTFQLISRNKLSVFDLKNYYSSQKYKQKPCGIAINMNTSLTELSISSIDQQFITIDALKKKTNLIKLDIWVNNIEGKKLFPLLSSLRKLEDLEVWGGKLCGSHIGIALSQLPSLTRLRLGRCEFKDNDLDAFWISTPSNLRILELDVDGIGDGTDKRIAEALPKMTSLTYLSLRTLPKYTNIATALAHNKTVLEAEFVGEYRHGGERLIQSMETNYTLARIAFAMDDVLPSKLLLDVKQMFERNTTILGLPKFPEEIKKSMEEHVDSNLVRFKLKKKSCYRVSLLARVIFHGKLDYCLLPNEIIYYILCQICPLSFSQMNKLMEFIGEISMPGNTVFCTEPSLIREVFGERENIFQTIMKKLPYERWQKIEKATSLSVLS